MDGVEKKRELNGFEKRGGGEGVGSEDGFEKEREKGKVRECAMPPKMGMKCPHA